MNKTWQDKAREAMRRLEINQDDIADGLGKSKGTISNWFSGRHPPSLEDLKEISKMLGLSIAEMLSEDDCLARNQIELETLRALREIPEDQRDRAAALIAAVLSALREPLPPTA